MKDLKQQLIRLGYENPELRPHLTPVLDNLSGKTASSTLPKKLFVGGIFRVTGDTKITMSAQRASYRKTLKQGTILKVTKDGAGAVVYLPPPSQWTLATRWKRPEWIGNLPVNFNQVPQHQLDHLNRNLEYLPESALREQMKAFVQDDHPRELSDEMLEEIVYIPQFRDVVGLITTVPAMAFPH